MKTYPPGYFTAPIYKPTTWPPGFKPTLYETWGHKSAAASTAASANRDARVANGCAHSTGTIDLPGTPQTAAPAAAVRRTRPKGSVAVAITALLSRPEGAITDDIAHFLGMAKTEATQRLGFFASEQRRMGKPLVIQIPTGFRRERRYFIGKAAADVYRASNPLVRNRDK